MRLERLDIFRGIAIVLMVVFHLNYSLVNIFSMEMLNFSEDFWYIIGKIAANIFILVAGFSFFLSENKNPKKIVKKYFRYSVILGIIAVGISFITFAFFPTEYIRFGILHFFSLGFVLLIFFRKLGYYNFILGSIIIIYGAFLIPIIENQQLYWLGFTYLGFTSADYYPIFPYMGVLLLGYSLGKIFEDYKYNKFLKTHRKLNISEKFLVYISKKSLIIYLIHQPIIIGSLYILGIGE